MLADIAPNTAKQYSSALKYWWDFCQDSSYDPFCAAEEIVLSCLTKRFGENATFQTLNTLRSAIHYINSGCGDSKNFQKFFKGVFRLRPTKPRYESTWDIGVVLNKLEEWGETESLSLQKLTLKLVMLLALGTAFRCQALSLIQTNSIKIMNNGVEIKVKGLTKTSKPGTINPSAFLPFFEKKRLCVASTVLFYLEKTKDLRKAQQLLISYVRPYGAVGTQTISRWLRYVMTEAGVEDNFTAHSTRHAATSRAYQKGIKIDIIKNAAGWSKTSKVFSKFYNRPILTENFAKVVLS